MKILQVTVTSPGICAQISRLETSEGHRGGLWALNTSQMTKNQWRPLHILLPPTEGRQQLREEIRWRLFPINNGQFNYSRDRDEALSSLLAAEVRQELHGAATGRWHILLHVHSFSMLHRMKHSQVIPAFLSDVHHPGIRENAGKRLLNHNRSF